MALTDFLKDIADAIRYAEGSSGEINAQKFAERIRALSGGQPIPPTPIRPTVPSGTWQLKTTTPKKYVIIGTDDDNNGNPAFLRLLRTYNLPYVSNTEAETIAENRAMGTDVLSDFTDSDAPALFSNGVRLVDFCKYIHDNNLGEVAQHGASSSTLWDSSKLDGTVWTNIYSTYTSQGGTKSETELKNAIKLQLADTDVQQGASYVMDSRETIENALGFYINTVGIWGGSPTATIDGVELNLNSIKGGHYDWQGHDYWGISPNLQFEVNKTCYDIGRVGGSPKTIDSCLTDMHYGNCIEFFWHMPFNDAPFADFRGLFERLVANNEVEVVTRYQYSQMGEYVDNPIKSIAIARNGSLNVGDTDSDSAYSITVTYNDGTTSLANADAIIDRSAVDTSASGTYEVKAYYRGFNAKTSVNVMASGMTYPDGLKDKNYWFIVKDVPKNILIAYNTTSTITSLNAYNASAQTNGPIVMAGGAVNTWTSSDDGANWEQFDSNFQTYGNYKLSRITGVDQGDKIAMVEYSNNFELKYFK